MIEEELESIEENVIPLAYDYGYYDLIQEVKSYREVYEERSEQIYEMQVITVICICVFIIYNWLRSIFGR